MNPLAPPTESPVKLLRDKTLSSLSVLLLSVLYPTLYLVATRFCSLDGSPATAGITLSLSVLVAIAGIRIFQQEADRKAKLVYMNWAAFFLANPVSYLLYLFFEKQLLRWDVYAGVYYSQYTYATYYFLLPASIVYGALIVVIGNPHPLRIYLITFVVVGALWLPTFAPYFQDARYLYSTQDVIDYRAIARTLEKLRSTGNLEPSVGEISRNTSLSAVDSGGPRTELAGDVKAKRISELLPFLEGDNHALLIYRPLYKATSKMSLLSTAVIVLYLFYAYRHDPPIPAYFDKLMLLMFPYCLFETIHSYVFSLSVSKETYLAMFQVGQLFSCVIMIGILWILKMRLQFVSSVEGKYYEFSIRRNHRAISRWRDVVDNWVIRQFVNGSDLDRRFLIRDERGDDADNDLRHPKTH
jgi:hypothetical protein